MLLVKATSHTVRAEGKLADCRSECCPFRLGCSFLTGGSRAGIRLWDNTD